MKAKIFILFVAALFMQKIFAQKQLPITISVQENAQGVNQKLDTIATENKKLSYTLFLEYGVSSGIIHFYHNWENGEEIRTISSALGFSLTAINNIAFNDKFLLGIGGGIEYRTYIILVPEELAGLCFLNFRYYFNKSKKNVTPMLNMAMGGRMAKEADGFFADNPWHLSETMYGVYGNFSAGFKVKLFSFQGGVLFWTKGNNLYGVDAVIKAGLNF